jgi:hypothetical protein
MFGSPAEKEARFGPPIPPPSKLPPRLLSLGAQAIHVPAGGRSQKPRIEQFEVFVELGRVGNSYLREPHSSVLHQQIIRSGGETEVLERFEVFQRDRHPVSGNHPAGRPNEVIPFPEVSETERQMARALFARPESGPGQTVTPAIEKPAW